MKKVFKVLLILVLAIFILIFSARIYLNKVMERSLPDYNQDILLNGLYSEVEIFRDAYAVPHIYADNEQDLYRATGYVMAQDRLWQMDLLRKLTQGRLTEIFGEDMLSVDILFRSMKIEAKSHVIIDSTQTEILRNLEAYADGVNQYIKTQEGNLPVEFKILGYQPEPWEPVHSINLIGYMAWSLKAGWVNLFLEELRQKVGDGKSMELLPNVTQQKELVFPVPQPGDMAVNASEIFDVLSQIDKLNLQVFNASNNWAVSGEKTQTGKPLLANDMHLEFNLPGTWFQIHQVVEGKLNVTGLALPGQPLVIAGHNENIAWGMTNAYVDNLDLFEHKPNPDNNNEYLFNGKWIPFEETEEKFMMKKGGEKVRKIRFDHRGPVISDFREGSGKTLSMKWIGSLYSNELEAVYQLNRAQNWDEFKQAVDGFIALGQNINYADRQGNIGIYCCAGVPIRNRDIMVGLLPGWTDKYDWQGLVPFEQLPHEFNPSRNYVSSANNRTVDDSYPYHIGTWYALPYRIQKIRENLDQMESCSPGDFMLLQTNLSSGLAQTYTPIMLEHLMPGAEGFNSIEQKVVAMLENWDYSFEHNQPQALIFETLYLQILDNLLKDEMGEELYNDFLINTNLGKYAMENAFHQSIFTWSDDLGTTAMVENLTDIVMASFKETVQKLSKQQGKKPEKWSWGKVHRLQLKHPLGEIDILDRFLNLNRGPYPTGGSWHTIAPFSYNFGQPFKVGHGASHRHIYDLANWDNSLTVMPTGNSGIAASPYYSDQTELYINNKYHQDFFSRKLVVENAKYKAIAKPAEN
jgi:penicillin G amidase